MLFDKSCRTKRDQSEEVGTLLYAQESAIIQIILEFCISPDLMKEDKGTDSVKPI